MLPGIKYLNVGGKTPGNPRVGDEQGRQGGKKQRDAVGSIKAALMLTWAGMRHRRVTDATSEDLVVSPLVLADPTPWP